MNKAFKKIYILLALIIGINPMINALTWNETITWAQEKKDNTVEYIRNHKREIAIGLGATALSSYATYRYMKHRQAPRLWITINTKYTFRQELRSYTDSLKKLGIQIAQVTYCLTLAYVVIMDQVDQNNAPIPQQQYECDICGEEKNGNICTLLHCNHRYCDQCLNTMVDMAIQHQITHTLVCPHEGCPQRMNDVAIRNICHQDNQKLNQYAELAARERLLAMPNARHCPTPDCNNAYEYNEQVTNRECPDCNQNYCANCLLNHQNNVTCEQAIQHNIRDDANEAANQEWRQINTKQCPQCTADIQKNGGCNVMRCRQCAHRFCWVCLQPRELYDPDHRQCPLY